MDLNIKKAFVTVLRYISIKIIYGQISDSISKKDRFRRMLAYRYAKLIGDIDECFIPYLEKINSSNSFYTSFCCDGDGYYWEKAYITIKSFNKDFYSLSNQLTEIHKVKAIHKSPNDVAYYFKNYDFLPVMESITRWVLENDNV